MWIFGVCLHVNIDEVVLADKLMVILEVVIFFKSTL